MALHHFCRGRENDWLSIIEKGVFICFYQRGLIMNFSRLWIKIVVIIFAILVWVTPAFAASITIDGSFADWAGKAMLLDPGGVDDETSPLRADITEFRADSDSGGLYLLMAWDNTSFNGGNATTAGLTIRDAIGAYYRIYATASNDPPTVPLSTLIVASCADSSCKKQTDLCAGSACTGALAGSGATLADPWAGHPIGNCSGINCNTLDTAVELYIPWTLVGGTPGDGQSVFIQFGSYPSGPAQAPKDDTGPNGITCKNVGGVFNCYSSTPTVVSLTGFQASSTGTTGFIIPVGVVGLLLPAGLLVGKMSKKLKSGK
jgi:hypothetical protein